MNLPIFKDDNKNMMLMQNKWSSILNPVITNNLNSVLILKDVQLFTGDNVINHLLGRMQQGWFWTDIQGPAIIYRSAAFNSLTLTLNSSANVIVNIGVF